MPVGLQVFTDAGVMQIDSDVKMSSLVYRLTFNGPFVKEDYRPEVPDLLYRFDLVIPADIRFLFFRSEVGRTIFLKSKVGTTYRFLSTSNAQIDLYGFIEGIQNPSTSGLQLFDSSGALTFDSNSKFMKVADTVEGPASGFRKNWPMAGRTYAAGISMFPKRITGGLLPPGIGIYYLWSYGVWVSATNFGAMDSKIWFDSTGTETPPSPSPVMQRPTLVAIDVSNY